jgi:hypothetical protein
MQLYSPPPLCNAAEKWWKKISSKLESGFTALPVPSPPEQQAKKSKLS